MWCGNLPRYHVLHMDLHKSFWWPWSIGQASNKFPFAKALCNCCCPSTCLCWFTVWCLWLPWGSRDSSTMGAVCVCLVPVDKEPSLISIICFPRWQGQSKREAWWKDSSCRVTLILPCSTHYWSWIQVPSSHRWYKGFSGILSQRESEPYVLHPNVEPCTHAAIRWVEQKDTELQRKVNLRSWHPNLLFFFWVRGICVCVFHCGENMQLLRHLLFSHTTLKYNSSVRVVSSLTDSSRLFFSPKMFLSDLF